MREFKGAHLNPTLLSLVYKRHKILKRAIKYKKDVKGMDEAEYRQEVTRIKRELTRRKNQGYRIIYADETMVTRKCCPLKEYCLPKNNVTFDQA